MGAGQQGVSASVMWTWPLFERDLPAYVLSWRANFNHQDSNMQLPDKTQETAPKTAAYPLFDEGALAVAVVRCTVAERAERGDEVHQQIVTITASFQTIPDKHLKNISIL
jgi:hypothetical protein